MRTLTRCGLLVPAIVALASGCGVTQKEQTLSASDLGRIAIVRPTTRGWDWPRKPVRERLRGPCVGRRWWDADKLGVDYVCLAGAEAAAHKDLEGSRAFARSWAKRAVGGGTFTDLKLEGLGDEAWRIQEDFSGGQEVTLGWRRGRLLLQVHIQCIFQTCPSDIRAAARAWADALDDEAVHAINT